MTFDQTRRRFFKHVCYVAGGLTLGCLTSGVPSVFAESLTVPKLSYNPNISQLLSDYTLQQQMLSIDLVGTSLNGKGALGFDDNYVNFLVAKTSQSTQPFSNMLLNILIDRNHSGGNTPDIDDFVTICQLEVSTQQKSAGIRAGDNSGSYGPRSDLTFPWDVVNTKSYFSPNTDNYLFAMQVPNSYMGQGGTGRLYGFCIDLFEGGSSGPQIGAGYPASNNETSPQTWGTFSTAMPIPELPTSLSLLVLTLSIGIGVLCTRKKTSRSSR